MKAALQRVTTTDSIRDFAADTRLCSSRRRSYAGSLPSSALPCADDILHWNQYAVVRLPLPFSFHLRVHLLTALDIENVGASLEHYSPPTANPSHRRNEPWTTSEPLVFLLREEPSHKDTSMLNLDNIGASPAPTPPSLFLSFRSPLSHTC